MLFSCLTTRAVHIELIAEMSTSAFINALCRFISIRGKVKLYRSDRGTNFVGATEDLGIQAINVDDRQMKDYLLKTGSTWIFNSPCSSHMGGACEYMIGSARKILDSMISKIHERNLTHDVLATFMAEVSAIINNRPLVSVSTDAATPFILTPATLLTQKTPDACVVRNLGEFTDKDLYKSDWKRVQALSDRFWTRWKGEYLSNLQNRRKWTDTRPNLKEGDVVLLRDKSVHRNQWPLAVIEEVLPSSDEVVRKVIIRLVRDGRNVTYTRPVNELILLVKVP